jgi:phage gpG-like protein
MPVELQQCGKPPKYLAHEFSMDGATLRQRIYRLRRTLRANVLAVITVMLLVAGSATSYAASHRETGKATSVPLSSYDGNYRVVDASLKKFASQKILVAAHDGSATISGKPGNIHVTLHCRHR